MRKYLYCENGFCGKAAVDAQLLGKCRIALIKAILTSDQRFKMPRIFF